jgi:hypothetical protein
MRKLFGTLAWMDCVEAAYLLASGERRRALRLISRAASYLESRARTRDSEECWRAVLGADRGARA